MNMLSDFRGVHFTYSLPPNDQVESRLLRLPVELRLQILRELLLSDEVLDTPKLRHFRFIQSGRLFERLTFAENDKVDSGDRREALEVLSSPDVMWRNGFDIYPNVLQACQQLLLEGWPILYGDNTLRIHTTAITRVVPWAVVPAVASARLGVLLYRGLDLLGRRQSPLELHDTFVAIALKFSKFEVVVSFESGGFYRFDPCGFRDVIEPLGQVFRDSKTSLRIEHAVKTGGLARQIDGKDYLLLLNAFRLTRFKTFGVTGIPEHLYDVARNAMQVLTSKEPVFNLYPALRRLDIFKDIIDSGRLGKNEDWAQNKMRSLKEATLEFNVERFARTRKQLMQEIEKDFMRQKLSVYEDDNWR